MRHNIYKSIRQAQKKSQTFRMPIRDSRYTFVILPLFIGFKRIQKDLAVCSRLYLSVRVCTRD